MTAMRDKTTIVLQRKTRERLAKKKTHPRQSYDEVINMVCDIVEAKA